MPFQKENLQLSYHWLKDSFHSGKTQVAPSSQHGKTRYFSPPYPHNKRFVEEMVYDVPFFYLSLRHVFREPTVFSWVFFFCVFVCELPRICISFFLFFFFLLQNVFIAGAVSEAFASTNGCNINR